MRKSQEPGAPAPAGTIPLCIPYIAGNEWRYVKECLDTNWVSSVESFVDRFEDELAAYIGAKSGGKGPYMDRLRSFRSPLIRRDTNDLVVNLLKVANLERASMPKQFHLVVNPVSNLPVGEPS